MGEPIEIKSDSFRVDFKVQVLNTRPDGIVEMAFIPDPERYEWLDDDEHGRVLRDIKTNTMIPEAVFAEMAEQAVDVPIYAPPKGIPDAPDLLDERRKVIEAALSVEGHPEELASPSAEVLAAKAGKSQEFAVLAVDVVDSTRHQAENAEGYRRTNEVLLREIAAVTAVFGGVVIKFTGDGGLVAFLGPGFNVANDMVFDAATALVADVYAVMNPALRAAGLPRVDVRVGLDMNEAQVTAVGSEDSHRQNDVLGVAVSMAAKIESVGAPGEVWVGQTLYETLHISRQNKLELGAPNKDWNFVNRAGKPYELYRLPMVPPLPAADS
jgi:class 3 adenylate cyclase